MLGGSRSEESFLVQFDFDDGAITPPFPGHVNLAYQAFVLLGFRHQRRDRCEDAC